MPPRRKTSLKERNKPSAAKSTPKRKSLQELDAFAAVASSAVPIPTLAASSSPPPSTATTTTATKYSKAYIDMEAEDSDSTSFYLGLISVLIGSFQLFLGSDEEVGERRQVHNLCERNRRHLIKEGFIMLQSKGSF